MARSLRTRLFLTVAIVLSIAVVASSFLSRRATLVEVHEIVTQPVAVPVASLEAVRARLQAIPAGVNPSSAGSVLAEEAARLGRPLLLVRPDGAIVAASDRRFDTARVRRGPGAGDLTVETTTGADRTAIAMRGAPPLSLEGPDGTPLLLYPLPEADDQPRPRRGLPTWVLTTISIGGIALVVTFALSRRILRPVGELTAAVAEMQGGARGVQVRVAGDDEIARLGGAFNAMSATLADVERVRRQMVTDVAHELRSPVTNLRCGLEAIQDGLARPDRAAIDALHEETLFLQRLIEDLQDLSLAESGRLDLRLGPVDLEAVVRRAAAPAGSGPGDVPVVVTASSTPAVTGDAGRIEQVFRNLISNARRHTAAPGTISVSLRTEGSVAIVDVTDTGAGIHPDHLPHVFDRFYRADASRARATGGAGLGLAIAKQIVLAHGGSIAAASAGTNAGATFTVSLPTGSRSASESHLRPSKP